MISNLLKAMSKRFQRLIAFVSARLYLLVLAYGLTLACVVTIYVNEIQPVEPQIQVTRAEVLEKNGSKAKLAFYGEGLHDKVRSLYVDSKHREHTFLWHLLPGASIRAVDASDNLALIACYVNKLISVDLTSRESPRILGSIDLPEAVKGVKLAGQQALVSLARGAGVAVVDLSDPEKMRLVGQYALSGYISDMVSNGRQVYYVSLREGIGVVDLEAESPAPQTLWSMQKAWKIALADQRIAVGSMDGNLFLFELSGDGSVREVFRWHMPGGESGGIRGLSFTENSLAVAIADQTLRTFPLDSWPKMKENARLVLPGVPYHMVTLADRDGLAVSLVAGGVAQIDMLASGQGVLKGHLALPTTIVAMAAYHDTLFLSGQGGHKRLSSISLRHIDGAGFDPELSVDDQFNYLYSLNNHLFGYRRDKELVDFGVTGTAQRQSVGQVLMTRDHDSVGAYKIGDDFQVSRIGSLVTGDRALDALQVDDSLYVLHSDGIRVLTGPSLNRMVDDNDLEIAGGATRMHLLPPSHLLVATRKEGLKFFDISDRVSPVLVASLIYPSHLQSNSNPRSILLNGKTAYISQGSVGIYVVDVGNPEEPGLLQIVNTPGHARGMVLYEDLLLVADGDKGVYMIDASDKDQILPIGSIPTPIPVSEIALVADGMIVSSHPGGTLKLPLPKPLDDTEYFDNVKMSGVASGVEVGDFVYFYDEQSTSRVSLTTF